MTEGVSEKLGAGLKTAETDAAELAQQLPRLIDCMRWGMTQIKGQDVYLGHGTDHLWDEMLQLAFGVLGLPLEAPGELLTAQLLAPERIELIEAIKLRVNQRVPVPYITHCAWFARLGFYIDERALIPRSPFAEIIQNDLSLWLDGRPPERILELCTGSGCIAIVCALHFPEAEVVATDISDDALAVAQINQQRFGQAVEFLQGDLFADAQGQFDLIIANPPYVTTADWQAAPLEFHHEPRLALEAGEDGLDCVRRILLGACDYLTEDGVLLVEVGDTQPYFEERFPSCPVQWIALEQGGSGIFAIGREDLKAYLETPEAESLKEN